MKPSAFEQTQKETVIVYGPQGCGKTTNAAALAVLFGKTKVVDYDPRIDLSDYGADTLVLTNTPLPGAIDFYAAMRVVMPLLCVNCCFHEHVAQPNKGMSEHQCRHPANADPVTGSPVDCSDERLPKRACGPDGSLFATPGSARRAGQVAGINNSESTLSRLA